MRVHHAFIPFSDFAGDLLRAQGLTNIYSDWDLRFDESKRSEVEEAAITMTVWPDKDSVKIEDGRIFIKLSDSE